MTTATDGDGSGPGRRLSAGDAAVLVLGVVLGVGIFRSPQVVAANSGGPGLFLALWVVGGAISAAGALCYAELATAYPDAGGEYHFISRAFGPRVGFLAVWSRMTVIQTGSIAILAFVFGDYVSSLLSLGAAAPPFLAGTAVVGLTTVNVAGLRPGRRTQYLLTGASVLGLLAVVGAGAALALGVETLPDAGAAAADGASGGARPGLALVFVLLAFGGWSEGAYLSAEIRDRRRGVTRALVGAVAGLTLLYVAANAAYLQGLGFDGLARSDAVAATLARRAVGSWGAPVVGGVVVLAALSSANATVITGARSNYALGRDFSAFRFMGGWRRDRGTPTGALWVQGAISLVLVGFGAATRSGFEAMVAYTAPVFWLVLFFTGASVVVLRRREPEAERPYRVPLYPVLPLLFCAAAAYMAWSAVRNAGSGALLGVGVLAVGGALLVASEMRGDSGQGDGPDPRSRADAREAPQRSRGAGTRDGDPRRGAHHLEEPR